ncbi:hypothetical protein ACWD4G_15325 [Streptomyces sp. NPDC002643]
MYGEPERPTPAISPVLPPEPLALRLARVLFSQDATSAAARLLGLPPDRASGADRADRAAVPSATGVDGHARERARAWTADAAAPLPRSVRPDGEGARRHRGNA